MTIVLLPSALTGIATTRFFKTIRKKSYEHWLERQLKVQDYISMTSEGEV